ncbi:MAG: ribbon-helix-helix domain-containing protein [Longimicrobiales bacterium]|nr:ribbon-helix-helix domain-containing protein [Longimicrobiales bacterium]
MRTTLTLDDDVAAQVERLRAETDASLKDLVNEALRLGLKAMAEPPEPGPPYATPASSLGGCLIATLDDVADALALAEGEAFR